MEFLRENWWYLFVFGGYIYLMIKRGGCCGGHSDHSQSEHHQKDAQINSGLEQKNNHNDKQVEMALDPECNKYVIVDTAVKQKLDGKVYYFCSDHCRESYVRKYSK